MTSQRNAFRVLSLVEDVSGDSRGGGGDLGKGGLKGRAYFSSPQICCRTQVSWSQSTALQREPQMLSDTYRGFSIFTSLPAFKKGVVLKQTVVQAWGDLCFSPHRCHPLPAINQVRTQVNPALMCPLPVVHGDGGSEVPWSLGRNLLFRFTWCTWQTFGRGFLLSSALICCKTESSEMGCFEF